MSLTRFDCAVCDFPLPDDHSLWHTDPNTGEDVHARCCTDCYPPVHADQQSLAFTAKPTPDGTVLRLAQRPGGGEFLASLNAALADKQRGRTRGE